MVTLAKELQDYLDRNGLTVDVVGNQIAVIDHEGKVITTGATIHTAVKKVIWCNACYCQGYKPRGVRKKSA